MRALVEHDLDILLRMAQVLEARAGWARQVAVLEMTRGFAAALREELDFRIEARNIAAVAGSSRVRVPAVYGQWSTSRVLVMEYLDGVAVAHAEPVLAASGADRRGLLAALLGQVMLDGTFHADPHPGNVLLLRDGQLALIYFGSVGRLDPLQQAALRRLRLAVARRNPAELHDALLDLAQAARPQTAGDDLLEPALARFLAQHLGPGMLPDAAMFTTLFRLLADLGLVFPPVIAEVFRAMITLEGTLARLARFPDRGGTRTMAASWLGEVLGPASLRDAATDEALGLLPGAASAAAPLRPHHHVPGARPVHRQRAAARRRPRPAIRRQHDRARGAGLPRRGVRHHVGDADRRPQRPAARADRGGHRRHLAVPRVRLRRPVLQPGVDPAGDHRDHPRRHLT